MRSFILAAVVAVSMAADTEQFPDYFKFDPSGSSDINFKPPTNDYQPPSPTSTYQPPAAPTNTYRPPTAPTSTYGAPTADLKAPTLTSSLYPSSHHHHHEDYYQKCKDDIAGLQGLADDLIDQIAGLNTMLSTVKGTNQMLADWLATKAPQVTQNSMDVATLLARVG